MEPTEPEQPEETEEPVDSEEPTDSEKPTEEKSTEEEDHELPVTATDTFQYLLAGLLILVTGLALYLFKRRRV
ncbi:LPXTG cell wall anchor domain-containing protein [Gracilibacillus boraciitolerans]|uniref:LPXTG cell wall anchor domain-containing protein n=1 Tax=Gracilibacillus boraciitolerans TaxID=307521 RepID=UPI002286A7CB|nr:LPXTG cell wall anchor domain-containing protein [Gracilibacillus boraciitolerans]